MTDPTVTKTLEGPYAAAAPVYWKAGWRGVLPLPRRAKKDPPRGFTGREGAWPSFPDVQAWTEDNPAGNICLRMPPDVLGVDVDAYGQKIGGFVFAELEQRLGQLPPTWRSTSRDDGVSGIRFYRIPAGLRWPGILGPGIESIRYEHRYAVAWPSVHPDTGNTYRWITPDGATALGVVPTIDELPDLPDAWVEHFTGGELATDQHRADLAHGEVSDWLTARGGGSPCRHMDRAATRGLADLTTATSRHDAALQLTNRLIWLAGEGHTGATVTLVKAQGAFLAATAGDRAAGEAEAEWWRMIDGAVKIAAAAHPAPSADPCADPFAGLIATPPASTTRQEPPCPPAAKSPSASSAATPGSPTSTPSTMNAPAATSTVTTSTTRPATSGAPLPTAVAVPAPNTETPTSSTTDAEADDRTELAIHRAQAAAQEVERLRAQRAAARLLDAEDEEALVADRVHRKLIDDKALLAYKEQTEPPAPAFDLGTLADVLARPEDPPMRAAGLIPWSGSALVVAMRKTGKTTALLNYARSLITGEPFLGQFDMIPLADDARVAFLNYEVSGAQLARWADEVGVPADRLVLVNLRGRRNPLGNSEDRKELAQVLRDMNVEAVIVDPFGRAYTGISQNDNGEVQAFLVSLEQFVREEVGALDLMLATHAGWDGERTRGASALEDWGDTIITLTRDPEDESRRFMKAMGRDVDVDEDELVMDPVTRVLTRTGNGSRKATKANRKVAELAVFVVRAAFEMPGLPVAGLENAIRAMDDAPTFRSGEVSKAAKYAADQGLLRIEVGGPGRPSHHYATGHEGVVHNGYPQPLPPIPTRPREDLPTPPTPTYRGGVGVGGGAGGDLSHDENTSQPKTNPSQRGSELEWRARSIAGEQVEYNQRTGEVRPAGGVA